MPETSLARSRPEEQPALAGYLGLARDVLGFIPRTHCPQPTAQSLCLLPTIIFRSCFQGCLGLKSSSVSRELGAVDGRVLARLSIGLPSGEPSDQRLDTWASTYPTCHRLLQRAWGGHLRGQRHLEQVGASSLHRSSLSQRTGRALPLQALSRPPTPTLAVPSYLLVRGVTVAVRRTQRHLWG